MRPDPYARPQHPPSGAGIQLLLDLIEGSFRLLGSYRIELALIGLVWFAYGAALEWVGSPAGEVVTAVVLVVIMAVGVGGGRPRGAFCPPPTRGPGAAPH
jgi:hypothetical protein